ncbi:MAG TPA: GGDEF domain-containing protein [Geobacteraceae bacterium]
MTDTERTELARIRQALASLLRGESHQRLAIPADLPPELRDLAETANRLLEGYAEVHQFIATLSRGELDSEVPSRNVLLSPFKELHANLRHLVWQATQIARGDLTQSVDFLGEFSSSFNTMIASLREKRQAEEQLRYVSAHDALTGLFNRAFFNEELARLERGRHFPITIIVADLDGLKQTNDRLGHAAGDRLIQLAAMALRNGVRSDDILARIGGDEFAVILPDTGQEGAANVMERIRAGEAACNRDNPDSFVAISMGMATAETRLPLGELLTLADQRMYEDKAIRKGQSLQQAGGEHLTTWPG